MITKELADRIEDELNEIDQLLLAGERDILLQGEDHSELRSLYTYISDTYRNDGWTVEWCGFEGDALSVRFS
jgi:hypothetical protein